MNTMLLTRILALSDAVWYPLRNWTRPAPTNAYYARRDFAKSGVPWQSEGATEADRKAMQRALEELVAEGLVVVRRPFRVKTLAVRLTDEAEVMTRRRIGLPGAYSSWMTAGAIREYSNRPGEAVHMTDLHVSESRLIAPVEGEARRQEILLVEEMLLYALTRGLVDSNADLHGRVSYRLTEAGWAWLDAGIAPPNDDLEGEVDAEAADLYGECRDIALHRLCTAQPRIPGELGLIPLPVSIEGLTVDTPKAKPETVLVK